MKQEITLSVDGRKVFENHRHSGTPFISSVDELIDNSIQHGCTYNGNVNVSINVFGRASKKSKDDKGRTKWDIDEIAISDDGVGIKRDNIDCFNHSVPPKDTTGLSQFGQGVPSTSSIGDVCIKSKHITEMSGWRIDKLDYNKKLVIHDDSFISSSGTIYTYTNLQPIVPQLQRDWVSLASNLGAIYYEYLTSNNDYKKHLTIVVNLVDKINPSNNISLTVYPEAPLFRRNEPLFDDMISGVFTNGEKWSVMCRFGPPAEIEEIQGMVENGGDSRLLLRTQTARNRGNHPYALSGKHVVVFYRGKRFPMDQRKWIHGIQHYNSRFDLSYILEIKINYGLRTVLSKDEVIMDNNSKEAGDKIWHTIKPFMEREIARLDGNKRRNEDYYKETLEEKYTRKGYTVCREEPLDVGGRVDLTMGLGNEKRIYWEVEDERAGFQKVWQAAGYPILTNNPDIDTSQVILAAPGFSIYAKAVAKRVKEVTGVTIILRKLQDEGFAIPDLDEQEAIDAPNLEDFGILTDATV